MRERRLKYFLGLVMVLLAGCVQAQMGPPPGGPMGGMPPPHGAPPGQWWRNPEIAKLLALTPEQTNAIDGILQQNRQPLFDLSMAVQREDFAMEGLMDADQPDEADGDARDGGELSRGSAAVAAAGYGEDVQREALRDTEWQKIPTCMDDGAGDGIGGGNAGGRRDGAALDKGTACGGAGEVEPEDGSAAGAGCDG